MKLDELGKAEPRMLSSLTFLVETIDRSHSKK